MIFFFALRWDLVQWKVNISQTALALALIVKVTGRSMFCVLLLFGRIHSTICLVRMQTDLEAQVLEQTSVMLFCLNSVIRWFLPVGFCLSVFHLSVLKCNFYRKCFEYCTGLNKFLEYSGREEKLDTLTAFKYYG